MREWDGFPVHRCRGRRPRRPQGRVPSQGKVGAARARMRGNLPGNPVCGLPVGNSALISHLRAAASRGKSQRRLLIHRPCRLKQPLNLIGQRTVRRVDQIRVLGQQGLGFRPARRAVCGCPALNPPPAASADRAAPSQKKSPGPRVSRSYFATAKPSDVRHRNCSRSRTASLPLSEIRMQQESAAPRPTRPRSWCSADRPNRSAFSMTMTVAFGTSTPTSMTVVETSTSSSPALNLCMTSSFSFGFSLPCSRPMRRLGSSAQAVSV